MRMKDKIKDLLDEEEGSGWSRYEYYVMRSLITLYEQDDKLERRMFSAEQKLALAFGIVLGIQFVVSIFGLFMLREYLAK